MDIKEFYEKIDKEMIEEFVNAGQEEHLTLDFITVNRADLKHPDDKKNLAKALSGFANSSGGIIVWGIEAKKNQEEIDCACGVKEIQPLKLLISRLNQLTGELVNPIVEGVIHREIETSNHKGFAKTLILESDSGPHMAKGGIDRYYKRSGDSFRKMEHFDIEDMFGRRKKPKLSLFPEITGGGSMGSVPNRKFDCHLYVCIRNEGRGLAKHVAIEIKLNEPYHLGDQHFHTSEDYGFQILRRPGSEEKLISLGVGTVIHPKSSLRIALIPIKVHESGYPPEEVIIEAQIMAEDMRTVEEKKVITGEEIREKIIPHDE